ncbi:hypothetical protein PR202_ga23717 [Eleusine coracana subsp. coracana]|uniref:Uncharacterized protein n=1 Tax=Eleusine coracana subsp. coracana TaxID=191504 RepID=A0AAV5D5Y0_ELECO|nr:hypothetical protein QOZ80_1AG0006970 [Eleusine coracana subsp. coracana]GJN06032.1 hypothetical protein PR202_ga23717 [Eleusine coracana subsp. coracana]
MAASVVVSLCTSIKNAKPWTTKQRRGSSSPPAPQPDETSSQGGISGSFVGKKQQLLASLSRISGGKKQLLASLSGIGGKAAAVAKMVSWKKRSTTPAEADDWSSSRSASDNDKEAVAAVGVVVGARADDEEEALWKKAIIMGDKCRPLQFSGHIAYDSDGNRLPHPPAPAPATTAAAEPMIKKTAAAADADQPMTTVNINAGSC